MSDRIEIIGPDTVAIDTRVTYYLRINDYVSRTFVC